MAIIRKGEPGLFSRLDGYAYDNLEIWEKCISDDRYLRTPTGSLSHSISADLIAKAPPEVIVMSTTAPNIKAYCVYLPRHCENHGQVEHEIFVAIFNLVENSVTAGYLHHGSHPGRNEPLTPYLKKQIEVTGIPRYFPYQYSPPHASGPKDELSTAGGIRVGYWDAFDLAIKKEPEP